MTGYLLIVASLIAGSLAATTAYAPRLENASPEGEPLTLAAPAGRDPAQPDRPAVAPGEGDDPVRLTPELTTRLRSLQVERVRVKEFAIERWDHAWVFGLSMGGLVLGGVLVRRQSSREIAARVAARPPYMATPQALVEGAHRDVGSLLRDVAARSPNQQAAEIMRRVEAIQASYMAPFVEARGELMGRFGVAGFARVMDPFAVAERQLNRAWSTAADHHAAESLSSLEHARASLEVLVHRLRRE